MPKAPEISVIFCTVPIRVSLSLTRNRLGGSGEIARHDGGARGGTITTQLYLRAENVSASSAPTSNAPAWGTAVPAKS